MAVVGLVWQTATNFGPRTSVEPLANVYDTKGHLQYRSFGYPMREAASYSKEYHERV